MLKSAIKSKYLSSRGTELFKRSTNTKVIEEDENEDNEDADEELNDDLYMSFDNLLG